MVRPAGKADGYDFQSCGRQKMFCHMYVPLGQGFALKINKEDTCMKKLVSLVLAIAMLLTAASALAEACCPFPLLPARNPNRLSPPAS